MELYQFLIIAYRFTWNGYVFLINENVRVFELQWKGYP